MEKHWANPDLHLDLNGPRLGASLEDALRSAVRDGRLVPGTRLPASRVLAADLGIARNTVADAYSQLAAEGWLTAKTGAGTWVAGQGPETAPALPGPAPAPPAGVPSPRYDMRSGAGDLSAFPRREWLAAARKALSAVADRALDYPDPRGLPQLREALAGYVARTRGVSTDPGRIVVCAGFAHALALLSHVLRARGATTMAVEVYGHEAHRRIPESNGLRVVALPVDRGGVVADVLTSSFAGALPEGAARGGAGTVGGGAGTVGGGAGTVGGGAGVAAGRAAGWADAVLLTPAHQFPLGVTLQPERRRALVAWAARSGALLIEDDYDGEFRYDRHPVGAMQGLAPDHVVYAGTASKSLAPGLRLGWLAVPRRLAGDVTAAAEIAGGCPDVLSQLTLAEFIASGGYDRQVRQARLACRRRRDRMIAALRQAAPGVRVTGIAAGLHALVELPPGMREDEAVARAARHGLAVQALGAFYRGDRGGHLADRHRPALVVGYARPAGHAFTTALARLCAALADRGGPAD
ncbi:MAG: PLP-dependent aminotransferase family protein [Streptosporangiaceae bacterium]|nr:PLP-dependent aminotransferase family protein [Streptosporangiaceae bacterium]